MAWIPEKLTFLELNTRFPFAAKMKIHGWRDAMGFATKPAKNWLWIATVSTSVQIRKNKRHEIIHAFLFESGLAENSEWAQNEEMVDFFAIQFPKLMEAFKNADAI